MRVYIEDDDGHRRDITDEPWGRLAAEYVPRARRCGVSDAEIEEDLGGDERGLVEGRIPWACGADLGVGEVVLHEHNERDADWQW